MGGREEGIKLTLCISLDSPKASHGEGLVWFDAVHEVLHLIKELLALSKFKTLMSLFHITHHCKELCVCVYM